MPTREGIDDVGAARPRRGGRPISSRTLGSRCARVSPPPPPAASRAARVTSCIPCYLDDYSDSQLPAPSSLPSSDPEPGKDITDKDFKSDEAIWALYERWCKAYEKERDHAEMTRRFEMFKNSAEYVRSLNSDITSEAEQLILGRTAMGSMRKTRLNVCMILAILTGFTNL
uniref:Cathepsin propeptide inhibitor domain-containing protein n=1 Tax=Oryza punctata TaxID=4537 RepID=A0A0E0KJP2_ORYPU